MRLFYMLNKPELAIECFKNPAFEGVFDQIITYQIFLDLLYENGLYEDILSLFEVIVERQIDMAKYPRNSVVLAMAACYKLVCICLCTIFHLNLRIHALRLML